MRSSFLATIFGVAWTSAAAFGQVAESVPADLRLVVAELSHDNFANRERATRLLWESGNKALVTEILQHGATVEARSRAAQVLSSYRWGIVPGVSDFVREQIEQFRNSSLTAKHSAMSQLMDAGHLPTTAQCLKLISDPVPSERLHQHLRALMESIVPREFASGRDEEVQAFLTVLAPKDRTYHRDLRALNFQDDEPSVGTLSIDGAELLSKLWLFLQSGATFEQLKMRNAVGRDAAVFAFLVDQQRIAEAIDTLRTALDADVDAPAVDVLRNYLARETANAKVQHYSKKALNLSNQSNYQPTGIALSDGFRHVISFCHAYGLNSLIVESGQKLAARLSATSPTALPAFCAWAVHYPELRGLAIESAIKAHEAGVPAEFAYGPLCDSFSKRGRWFGKFIKPHERRNLLVNDARSGGWGALADVDAELLPLPVKGHVAMATGNWAAAASAFSQGAENATTLEEGAVLAYLASFSFHRDGTSTMAIKWQTIAEAIPLADERARSSLADTMQKLGDHSGALRNRKRLISLYEGQPKVDPTPLIHTLRLTARTLDLSKPDDLAFAPRVVERSANRTGEIAQDAAFFYRHRLATAIAAKQWDVAAMALQAAHRSAPGRLEVFELIAQQRDNCTPDLLRAAQKHLARTQSLWDSASDCFPENAIIQRHLDRCGFLNSAFKLEGN